MQFSIKQLIGVTTIVAVAAVALVFANGWWAALSFTVAIAVLLAATVFTCAATGASRFYWIGFAVFGWGYWLFLAAPILAFEGNERTNWDIESDKLISNKVLTWIYFQALPLIHAEPTFAPNSNRVLNGSRYPHGPDFARVGHSLFDILFAIGGGLVGQFAYRRWRKPVEQAR